MTGHGGKTIAVLYPGELGAALATLLLDRNLRVVTTTAGRSERTIAGSLRAGVELLPTLAEVARCAEVVIALVPPAAAEETAAAWCGLAHLAPADALYVDANSIGPERVSSLARRVTDVGRDFVDASINGAATNLAVGGTLFLSGKRAGEIAQLFGGVLRTQVLGDQPGSASTMKMLLGGLSKGLCALFAETAILARRHDMLGEMIDASARIYPGVVELVGRMLPTYARHAPRRVTETREMEETARAAGLEPCVLSAVRELHARLAEVPLDPPRGGWSLQGLVERLDVGGMLSGGEATK